MIQHVTRQIPPATLGPCLRFYALLGFAQVEVPRSIGDRAVWLQLGPTQLHLMPIADAAPDSGHVAILPEDYETVVDRLTAAGHEVEPRREHWGAPRSYVHDPAGNLVELMAAAPTADDR